MSNPAAVTVVSGGKHSSRARAVLRRAALAGAAASLAVGLLGPGADAQEDTGLDLPDGFAGAASSRALSLGVITPALVPVNDLFEFAAGEGRGTYEPANQEARSSLFFPGNGLVMGPGLLCGTFFGPNIPPEGDPIFGPIVDTCNGYRYPLAVYADSLNPAGQTEGALVLGERSDPVSLEAAGARARAALDATVTDAEVNDLRVAGAPALGSLEGVLRLAGQEPTDANLVAVDSLTSRTDQRIVDGALVAESEATVSGLRLLGGLVRIGSIVSRSQLTSLPGAAPEVQATVEASGVEVAGAPAQLTDDGLVLGDPAAPSGPVAQQLASQVAAVLQESGFRIEVLPVEQGEVDGIPFASAGGVLVEFSTPLSGLPPLPGPTGDVDVNGAYGVRLQLGTTGVRGFADSFDDADPAPVGGSVVRPPGGSAVGGTGGFRTAPPPAPGAGPGAAPDGAAVLEPSPEVGRTSALSDLFADRMAFLYLSFTLTALALCLAPKLTLPARFPGAG